MRIGAIRPGSSVVSDTGRVVTVKTATCRAGVADGAPCWELQDDTVKLPVRVRSRSPVLDHG